MASGTVKPPQHVVRTLPSTSKPLRSYFPYRWAHSPFIASHLVLLWVSLSVCLFCSVSMLALLSQSLPCLFLTGTHTNAFLCLYSLCLPHTNKSKTNTNPWFSPTLLPPSLICCSDDAGRLIHWWLINMINSSSVQFFCTGLMYT